MTEKKTTGVEAAAEWAPLDSIKGWSKNPRKNSATIVRVAELIKRFGWGRPIGARRQNGEIIWGHSAASAAHRLIRAWKKTSETKRAEWHADAKRTATEGVVPVRFRDDLSEREAHDLAIADNKSQEMSEWDDSLLAEHLQDATIRDAELMCFDAKSLEKLLAVPDESDEREGGGSSGGDGLKYQVVIECDDEGHQTELIGELEAKGLNCRPLIV